MSTKPTYEELEQRIRDLDHEVARSRQIEDGLRASEDRFRLLYEGTPLAYQSLDENGHILEINQAWLDTLGYTRDEVTGRSFADFISPEWLGHFKENFLRFKAAGEIQCVEFKMRKKDGSAIIVSFDGRIGKDLNGSFKQTHCILQDITDHKAAEEDLRLQSEIMGNMVEGVYLIRADDGIIIYANPKLEKMFGYDPGEMLGRHVSIVNAPREKDPEETAEEIMGALLETGEWHGEVHNIKKDATAFWCYANVSIFDHSQYGKVLISVHTDITDRKSAEENLRRSERKFADFMMSATEGFIVYDAELNVIEINEKALEIFPVGSSKDVLLGKNICDLAPNLKKTGRYEKYIEVMKTGESLYLEDVIPGEHFGDRYLSVKAFPVGKGLGIIFSDITKRKKHERQIRQNNQFLTTIIESLPYPFSVIDVTNYRVVLTNSKVAFNGNWKGSTCFSHTHNRNTPCDSTGHLCPLEEIKQTRKPAFVEHVHFDKNGDKHNVEVHAYPVFDKQERLIQMIEYVVDITARKTLEEQKERLIQELQESIAKVKVLSGILPICASCKKIRDDKGMWNNMESYINARSEAEFSHGICPECARELYPDMGPYDDE